jgi:chromosome segregation ATPase
MRTIRSSKFQVPGWLFAIRHSPFVIRHSVLLLGFSLAICGASRSAADSADDAETRLRDTLRSTVLQLRDAQNQIAVLQGAQADSDQKNKDLADQLALLKKHAMDDKAVADSTAAALTAKVADQSAEIARLNDALEKWKADDQKFRDAASTTEAARAKLSDEAIVLQRRVDYLEPRNMALFKLGNDILDRYANFSLGNALAEKEPFVGVTRVKLENLVQDYKDKLLDARAAAP